MKRIITIIVTMACLSSLSWAATPEEISKSYFEMAKQRQWTEVAKLYDPAALNEFRDMMSFLWEMPDEVIPQILEGFFGPGATRATVDSMSDIDFFSSFLQAMMAKIAELGQLDFKKVEILGSVPEGDTVLHVVTRTKVAFGDIDMEAMEVISFKKTGDKWGILMQGKLKGLAQQLKAALESKQP